MKAYLTMNPLGVFALDEKGVLIAKELFKGKFEKVAWKLRDAEEGLIEEEKRIISLLEDYELIIEKPVDIQEFKIQNPNAGGEYLRENFGLLSSARGNGMGWLCRDSRRSQLIREHYLRR